MNEGDRRLLRELLSRNDSYEVRRAIYEIERPSAVERDTEREMEAAGLQAESKLNVRFEQLKMLASYTHFHIGLYAAVGAAIITAVVTKPEWFPLFSLASLAPLAWAGFCGGIVAGNAVNAISLPSFRRQVVGPKIGSKEWCPRHVSKWEKAEHFWFWVAIIGFSILSSVGNRMAPRKDAPPERSRVVSVSKDGGSLDGAQGE